MNDGLCNPRVKAGDIHWRDHGGVIGHRWQTLDPLAL